MAGYIGQAPGQGQIQYFTFTATAGQTTFTGVDDNKYVLNYSAGFCDVFLNGRRLTPTSDYTALDGSTIVLQSAASVNDVIFVASASAFNTADWVTNAVNYVYTATAGQTTFTGSDDNANTLSYVNGTILVSVNGINIPQSDYTATNGTSVVLNSGVNVGDIVQIFSLRTMAVVNFLPLTGGTVTGTITVGNSSVNTQITAGNIALNGSTLLIGNSTSNVVLTGTTLTISNSTSNVSISPGPVGINAIATNTFTIGTGFYFTDNGTVGIGNSSPTTYLSIKTTNNSIAPFYVSNSTTHFFTINTDGSVFHDGTQRVRQQGNTRFRSDRYINDQGAQLNAYDDVGASFIAHQYLANNHQFLTGSAGNLNSLFLAANGNVGVGLTNPNAKLKVQALGTGIYDADFVIENSNSSGQAMITFMYSGAAKSRLRTDYAGGLVLTGFGGEQYYGFDSVISTGTNHRFYANSSTATAIILGNGNMGVGNTNPTNRLSINTTTFDDGIYVGGNARPRIILDSGNTTKTRIWHREAGWFAGGISTNISWPGQYNLDDTSKSGWSLYLDSGSDLMRITRAPAGSNPVTPASMLEIGSSGVMYLPNGKIQFPSTQSVSSDVNTLDDYEEGTWSPGIAFGGSGTTGMSISSGGSYVKIGSLVTCHYALTMTTKGSSTGAAWLTGLPFSSDGGQRGGGAVTYAVGFATLNNPGQFFLLMEGSGTIHVIRYFNGNSFTANDLDHTHFQNGTQIWGSFSYRTTQ